MSMKAASLELWKRSHPGWEMDDTSGRLLPKNITKDMIEKRLARPGLIATSAYIKAEAGKPSGKMMIAGMANANITDRMDERLNPMGCDTSDFQKNSVLLLQHNHCWPVGSVPTIKITDAGVKFEAWVGDDSVADLTEKQLEARSLVAQGILKAVSVGFIPKAFRPPTFSDRGEMLEPAVIESWELLELSLVSVPCNQDSLFVPVAKELQGEAKDTTVTPTTKSDDEEIEMTTKDVSELTAVMKQMCDYQKSQGEILQKMYDHMMTKPDAKPEDKPADEDADPAVADAGKNVDTADSTEKRLLALEAGMTKAVDSLAEQKKIVDDVHKALSQLIGVKVEA